jgi:hypothetical protein
MVSAALSWQEPVWQQLRLEIMHEDHDELIEQFLRREAQLESQHAATLQQQEQQLSQAQGEPACRHVLQRACCFPNHMPRCCKLP